MNSMIAVVFIALAVAAVNAGVIAPAPLVASPWATPLISSPVLGARSLVASPLSAGIIGAPGIAAPLAVSRSILAGPTVLSAAPLW